jgi:hypothetical protein
MKKNYFLGLLSFFIFILFYPHFANASTHLINKRFPISYTANIFKIREALIYKSLIAQTQPSGNMENKQLMSLFKTSGLYDKNSNKLFVFKNNKESDKLKNLLMGAIVSTLRTQSEAGELFTFIPNGNAACEWNRNSAVYCMPRSWTHFYFIKPNTIKIVYTLILKDNTMFEGQGMAVIHISKLKYSKNRIVGYIELTKLNISNPKNFWVWTMAYIKLNSNLLSKTLSGFSNLSYSTKYKYTDKMNKLVSTFNKINRQEHDILYYKWSGSLKTSIPVTVKFYPKKNGYISVDIQNSSNTPFTILLNKSKFLSKNGKIYSILWRTVNNKIIVASVSGSGCAIANDNNIFIANPGASCSLHLPVQIPGFYKSFSDILLNLGNGLLFDLKPVTEWEELHTR